MSPGQLPSPDFGSLVDVHLLQIPVPLWSRTQEHSDELLREFALIAADPDSAAVPARLTQLIEVLNQTYGGHSTKQEEALQTAADEGREWIDDLAYAMPEAAAEACLVLGRLMDEADVFCQDGQHLLTLTTPPELVRFRRWFLEQFVTQIGGGAPVAWPDYAPA